MSGYNATNSLSPMMFKKVKDEKGGGTRNERWRSKSVEHIYDADGIPPPANQHKKSKWPFSRHRAATTDVVESEKTANLASQSHKAGQWREVGLVKSLAPVVTCILPSLSMDFVASCLLAVGAVPLIPEDPEDVVKDLNNCKAVVVSASAPQPILEAFIMHFDSSANGVDIPFVLVADSCGTNDRKKQLILDVLEEIVPTVISGRLGDIYSVAQGVIEKNTSPLESPSDISDFSDEELPIPKVVVDGNENHPDQTPELPPVLRKFRNKKAKSISPPGSSTKVTNGGDSSSPPKNKSPSLSPRTSPRNSPVPSPRGVMKMLRKKGEGFQRVPTMLPMVKMKGQFRETQMTNVPVEEAMENAHKLCTYSSSFVHLYETNTLTSGEVVVEINTTQLGMGNLHSTLPCSAAVLAAVLACVDLKVKDSISVEDCAHGLAFHYVAAEEAGAKASEASSYGLASPGRLKQEFLDALHYLDEEEIRMKASIKLHSGQLKTK